MVVIGTGYLNNFIYTFQDSNAVQACLVAVPSIFDVILQGLTMVRETMRNPQHGILLILLIFSGKQM